MSKDKLTPRIEAYLLEKTRRLFVVAPDVNDAGDVHRMRVACRRLRVGLEFFAACFETRKLKQIQQQLRRLTRALGAVRSLDVNLDLLRKAGAHLPPGASAARLALERRLTRERRKKVVELGDLLRAGQVSKLGRRVAALIAEPARRPNAKRLLQTADAGLADFRRIARKRLRRFDERRGREPFHRLRIGAKEYRYGLEMARAIFDAAVAGRLEGAEKLQELMGDCHDAEVMLDYLREARNDHKDLAQGVRHLVVSFENEQQRHYDRVKKFLRGDRCWLKRVKLKMPRS